MNYSINQGSVRIHTQNLVSNMEETNSKSQISSPGGWSDVKHMQYFTSKVSCY